MIDPASSNPMLPCLMPMQVQTMMQPYQTLITHD